MRRLLWPTVAVAAAVAVVTSGSVQLAGAVVAGGAVTVWLQAAAPVLADRDQRVLWWVRDTPRSSAVTAADVDRHVDGVLGRLRQLRDDDRQTVTTIVATLRTAAGDDPAVVTTDRWARVHRRLGDVDIDGLPFTRWHLLAQMVTVTGRFSRPRWTSRLLPAGLALWALSTPQSPGRPVLVHLDRWPTSLLAALPACAPTGADRVVVAEVPRWLAVAMHRAPAAGGAGSTGVAVLTGRLARKLGPLDGPSATTALTLWSDAGGPFTDLDAAIDAAAVLTSP